MGREKTRLVEKIQDGDHGPSQADGEHVHLSEDIVAHVRSDTCHQSRVDCKVASLLGLALTADD